MKVKLFAVVCAIGAFSTNAGASDELREVHLDGRLHVADKTWTAGLRVFCTPVSNGALGIELIVPDAATRKDFDYDDFEGPDASAGHATLTRISLAGESGKTEVSRHVSGWYGVEPAGSFVFSMTQAIGERDVLTGLFANLDRQRGHVVWVQTSSDKSKRELRGAFDFDDAQAKRLSDVVAPCLKKLKK